MVEYSKHARAEVRARQKFFENRKVHKMSYLLHILDIFISSKLMVLKRIELLDFLVKKSTTAGKKTASFKNLKPSFQNSKFIISKGRNFFANPTLYLLLCLISMLMKPETLWKVFLLALRTFLEVHKYRSKKQQQNGEGKKHFVD